MHHSPPNVQYRPQFDYKLNPNFSPLVDLGSPYNYPNRNLILLKSHINSCKRALNTSGSSVGSKYSPEEKKVRHDVSVCSVSSTHSRSSISSLVDTSASDLDKTLAYEDSNWTEDELSESNVCRNCEDKLPAIAKCHDCPEVPSLCHLCLDAHSRVRLTKDHSVTFIALATSSSNSFPKVLEVLLKQALTVGITSSNSDQFRSTAASAIHKVWSETYCKLESEEMRTCEIVKDILLPSFLSNNLDVKVQILNIFQTYLERNPLARNTATIFAGDDCIREFHSMLSSKDSQLIVATLSFITELVKVIDAIDDKFSLTKLHSNLESKLQCLKDCNSGMSVGVMFNASKLLREMDKCLMK